MPDMAMPGMLTQEEMEQLAAAKGVDFDRLFLEGMIKHHQGALTMVEELFAIAGRGAGTGESLRSPRTSRRTRHAKSTHARHAARRWRK